MKIRSILIISFALIISGCKKEEIQTYTLTIDPTAGGTASPLKKEYYSGDEATIIAIPEAFHDFTGWGGAVNANQNPFTVKMDGNKNIVAKFTKRDTDGDGITDDIDQCENTPSGDPVGPDGCTLTPFYLDANGVTIKARDFVSPGFSAEFNGHIYTVVDEATLRDMIANNQDVSYTVTTYVTNMHYLFKLNWNPEWDISHWDTSNVTTMERMFMQKKNFNHNIGHWDTGKVENMLNMFLEAETFNQDIGNWDVSSVTDMTSMFYRAYAFNQNIGNWVTGAVKSTGGMFAKARGFNGDISAWDVSNVENMNAMFADAISFNQDLGEWDVSKATSMYKMFYNTPYFNQDISGWDVSNVEQMTHMFNYAKRFNQDLSSWNVEKVIYCTGAYYNTDNWTLPKPGFTNCSPI